MWATSSFLVTWEKVEQDGTAKASLSLPMLLETSFLRAYGDGDEFLLSYSVLLCAVLLDVELVSLWRPSLIKLNIKIILLGIKFKFYS